MHQLQIIDYTLCLIFMISSIIHFSMIALNKLQNGYINAYQEHFHTFYVEEQSKYIFSSKIDSKYVLTMTALIILNQQKLMLVYAIILYFNTYIEHMIFFNKLGYNIKKNTSLFIFLCMWLSIYYLHNSTNIYVSHLLLVISICVNENFQ